MHYCNVISTRCGAVEDNFLFSSDDKGAAGAAAEKKFIELVNEKLNQDIIDEHGGFESILEDGYITEFRYELSIMISWPEHCPV